MNHDKAVELLKDYAEKLHHLENGDVDPRDAEDYMGETYSKILAALTRPLAPNVPTEEARNELQNKLIYLMCVGIWGYTTVLSARQNPFKTYVPPTEGDCICEYHRNDLMKYTVDEMVGRAMNLITAHFERVEEGE